MNTTGNRNICLDTHAFFLGLNRILGVVFRDPFIFFN